MIKVFKIGSILVLLSVFATTSLFAETSKTTSKKRVKLESKAKVVKKVLTPQPPVFPEGFSLVPKKYYDNKEFPEGYYYTAKELVLLPTGEYSQKYLEGELEITKQINKHIYTVEPVTGFFEGIGNWFDGFFKDDALAFAKPVIYLSVPADAPNLTGMEFTFTKDNPVDIVSIKNMTDEEADIKGDRKTIPEYTAYFKYEGYLQIDDKFYPEKPKSVKSEKK
jgi:hypothetical protein